MRVRDLMGGLVHTLGPGDTIGHAAAQLDRWGVAAAPVLDASHRLVGVVDEHDLLTRVAATGSVRSRSGEYSSPSSDTVSTVMTTAVFTVGPDADIADVATTMLDRGARSVVVIAEAEVVGVLSPWDMLRAVTHNDDALRAEVQQRLDEYAGEQDRWRVSVEGGMAHVFGEFGDQAEQRAILILAQTVPGIRQARTDPPAGERRDCA
jgi:CBS domain-containing protein